MLSFKKLFRTIIPIAILSGTALAAETTPSSFNEVWDVVTVPSVQENMSGLNKALAREDIEKYGSPGHTRIPQYSGILDVLWSLVSRHLESSAVRTVNDHSDYFGYFPKLVHANGTCFSGVWEITEDSPYSGLFKKGSSALMIGRISTPSPQTTNEKPRAFGFAGKLFPTRDQNERVTTANFFTINSFNDLDVPHALDVAYVNEPPAVPNFVLDQINAVFAKADINPNVRPLYPIARAGQASGTPAVTPKWMRISVAPGVRSFSANDADFREELSAKNYPNGLVFDISVSNTTKDVNDINGWQYLGRIRTSTMVTSFGCDRRLHFSHPKFNDPAGK